MNSTLAPAAKRATTRQQRDELYALMEAGYYGQARVEIIGGELLTALPEKPIHDESVALAHKALMSVEGEGTTVYCRNYVELPQGDTLQPDVCVIGSDAQADSEQPLLIIEVAVATLRRDRTIKAELYASAGVAEYWIVNPRAGQIEVRRDPSGSEYVTHTIIEGDATVSPLFAPELSVPVASLIPARDRK